MANRKVKIISLSLAGGVASFVLGALTMLLFEPQSDVDPDLERMANFIAQDIRQFQGSSAPQLSDATIEDEVRARVLLNVLYGEALEPTSFARLRTGETLFTATDSQGERHSFTMLSDDRTLVYGPAMSAVTRQMITADGGFQPLYVETGDNQPTPREGEPRISEVIESVGEQAQRSGGNVPETPSGEGQAEEQSAPRVSTTAPEAEAVPRYTPPAQGQTPESRQEIYDLVSSDPDGYIQVGTRGPVIYMLTDPNCPACQTAHQTTDVMAAEGFARFRYLPVMAIRDDSRDKGAIALSYETHPERYEVFNRFLSPQRVHQVMPAEALPADEDIVAALPHMVRNTEALQMTRLSATPTFIFEDEDGVAIEIPQGSDAISQLENIIRRAARGQGMIQ